MSAYQGVVTDMKTQVGGNDVMFSCGFSTMKAEPKTSPDGQAFFWEHNNEYAEEADDYYYACRDGSVNEDGEIVGAYTAKWNIDLPKPQLIRFCPLLLSHVAKQRWSSSEQINAAWLVDIPPEAAAGMAKQETTPVDLYGLLELVILHELTHTRNGGETDDYESPNAKQVGGGGWLYARSVDRNSGWDNAESVAFQGLVSKLIQLGFRVDENGYLYRLEAPVVIKEAMQGNGSLSNGSHIDTTV